MWSFSLTDPLQSPRSLAPMTERMMTTSGINMTSLWMMGLVVALVLMSTGATSQTQSQSAKVFKLRSERVLESDGNHHSNCSVICLSRTNTHKHGSMFSIQMRTHIHNVTIMTLSVLCAKQVSLLFVHSHH